MNDTPGHPAGDALLVELARRLVETVWPGDVVARLGGDEFAVISRAVGAHVGPIAMAHRLLRALCQPVAINGRSVICTCSIGVAEPSGDRGAADQLLRDADLALYAAKRSGWGRVASFEASLCADIERRAALDAEIREAVIADQIEPWYQPIFSITTQSYAGAEVLARSRRCSSLRARAVHACALSVFTLVAPCQCTASRPARARSTAVSRVTPTSRCCASCRWM